jgi:hypothetical protein
MNARDWRFPMACPKCDAVAGTPHRVETDAATLTLALCCGDCHYRWEISAPSPSVFLKAQADRRKSPRRDQLPPH